MIEGSGAEAGSVSLTNGSGSGRPRNIPYGSYGSESATLVSTLYAVLRILDVYPGSAFFLIPDPGTNNNEKEEREISLEMTHDVFCPPKKMFHIFKIRGT
jgi:hypothetical protein